MSDEPDIVVPHREALINLLSEAAEIEHTLMCCYLYAAFSLKQRTDEGLSSDELGAVTRWRRTLIEVAAEEMTHLALVSNLLTAVGAAPHFARQNFPIAPGYHPSGVVVILTPFDAATLDHFVYLERPEGVDLPDGAGFVSPREYHRSMSPERLMPHAQDYETVGHLYRGVRAGFTQLARSLGERALIEGDPSAQVGMDLAPLPGMVEVTDLASALRALDTIVQQGEGAQGHAEKSHYRRFLEVREEYRTLCAARPEFAPARPVARNPVMRKPPAPEGRVFIEDACAARVHDVANATYCHMLRLLTQGFGRVGGTPAERRVLFDAAIELMRVMSPLASALTELPAGPSYPGINAGMSFATLRDFAPLPRGPSEWRVLAERARDLADGCDHVARTVPAVGQQAARIRAVADTLERTGNQAVNRVEPAPAVAAAHAHAVPASTKEGDVEEVRGKKLLLQFDTKKCIHSRFCVLEQPGVFKANVKGAWLDPDATSAEALAEVAHRCPSGAIHYQRTDGGPQEPAPLVNTVGVRENGPLAFRATLQIKGEPAGYRATLCRCGQSKNKPYCDGSHVAAKFTASGEPATQESQALAVRDGVLEVEPLKNGPLRVAGNLELISGTGRTINRVTKAALCRCGQSSNKPFCDGTHARVGFEAE